VNADGHREILGLHVTTSEDGAGWLAFFRDLVARSLSGVRLVTSDAHYGLTAAIGATLGGVAWQRSFVSMGNGGMVPLVHLRRRERTLAT
jgi:transposase-like protein